MKKTDRVLTDVDEEHRLQGSPYRLNSDLNRPAGFVMTEHLLLRWSRFAVIRFFTYIFLFGILIVGGILHLVELLTAFQ